jgi:predicted dehydrogenase
MERIRVGTIGSGGIVQAVHIPQLLSHGKVDFAWCADMDEATARTAAGKAGAHNWGTDYRKLLRDYPVDAVTVGTTHVAHFDAVMAALESGVHVCCEKPLAMNAAEAETMAAEAKRLGVITFVPFSYWFVPAARLLKDLIDEGFLGRLTHVNGYYGQGNAFGDGPMRWRFQKAIAGSGALGDLGSHLISLTHFWGGRIVRLTAHTKTFVHDRVVEGTDERAPVDVDDDVQVIGELENGALVNLSASRTYAGRANFQRVEVSGFEGGAVYDNSHRSQLEVCLGSPWTRWNQWSTMQALPKHHLTQMHVFADAILAGTAPEAVLPNFQIGLEVQRVMEAIERSATSGQWVEL